MIYFIYCRVFWWFFNIIHTWNKISDIQLLFQVPYGDWCIFVSHISSYWSLVSYILDTIWGCDLLQAKDPDGAIALADVLLHQLAELILNKPLSDLSAETFMTVETLLWTVFDIYWQSEVKVKDAVAELIGDKYIQCLNCLHEVLWNFLGEDTV